LTKIVLTTEDPKKAEDLARKLVENRLAACVNVIDIRVSVYYWNGIVSEPESLLIIKTDDEKVKELADFLKRSHSYEVPEMLAMNAEDLNPDYRRWLREYLGLDL